MMNSRHEIKIREYEEKVKAAFIADKIGDRLDKIADVDVHFILPPKVYAHYESLISEITNGEFNVAAGYNLVLLYTDPRDAESAGTVLYGDDLYGLVGAWSRALDQIAEEPDNSVKLQKFQGLHSFFRSALWVKPNDANPCASVNPLPRRVASPQKNFWRRLFN